MTELIQPARQGLTSQGPKMSEFDVFYHVLNPEGKILTIGHDPQGCALWCEHYVLILDDHAKYSVATYRKSSVIPNKAMLASQNTVEDFCKQVRSRFG